MVGMSVGFQKPFDLQVFTLDIIDHLVRRCVGRASRRRIEVQNTVDNRGLGSRGIGYNMGHGERVIVKKASDDRWLIARNLDYPGGFADLRVSHGFVSFLTLYIHILINCVSLINMILCSYLVI